MIELYTWSTPNGRKISIALEELGLPYRVHAIDISKGDQHTPEYTRINPNQKIPAIVDEETGISLFESGAILMYLARKAGKLLPDKPKAYWDVVQWLMWQKAQFGPMLGQASHFLGQDRGNSRYSQERFGNEAKRLYGVLERQLTGRHYIADSGYSIADIATWPWVAGHQYYLMDLNDYPNVLDWYLRVAKRPAVQTGWSIPNPSEVPVPQRSEA